MRVFVALDPADDVREQVASSAARVRKLDPTWAGEKWVAPENLHVTVAFAGELGDPEARRLAELLEPALAGLKPEDLVLASLAAVPSPRRAAMLWAVPGHDTPGLARLASAVRGCVEEVGGENDGRPFRAHLTLVRARRPHRISRPVLEQAWTTAPGHGKPPERIVSGATVTVYSSTLTPRGPVYDALARIPVGSA